MINHLLHRDAMAKTNLQPCMKLMTSPFWTDVQTDAGEKVIGVSLMAGNTTQALLERGFLLRWDTHTRCNVALEGESCVLTVGTYLRYPD